MPEARIGDLTFDFCVTFYRPSTPDVITADPEGSYEGDAAELDWEADTTSADINFLLNECLDPSVEDGITNQLIEYMENSRYD